MLEIDASVGYPGATVLAHVRLQVRSGEAVTLLGRNGSGKTSLLRTAAGLLHPRDGKVSVRGRDAADAASRALTGFVPDPPPLYEELTPWEHLELVHRLWGGAVDVEALDEVVAAVGLDAYLSQRCDTLSLGTRKRLGVALALLHRPVLLLLDEPFNGLDAATSTALRGLLAEHVRAGGALVASTHQPQLLDGVATRAVVLADGAVVHDGDPRAVPAPPAPALAEERA
jgi:ABC-type multidrug transport system ATPase subunit